MPHAYAAATLGTAVSPPSGDARPEPGRGWVLATVCGATVMVNLDLTAVNVALDDIGTDLSLTASGLTWVLNGYTLAFACLISVAGRLGDMRGRRRAFVLGAVVFTTASALCALAGNGVWLVAARVLQGGGAAFMFPAMLAIVATTYPGRERSVAIGTVVAVAGASQAAGPLVGGLLTDAFGWRLVFLVNIPIGIAAVVAATRLVHESRDEAAPQRLDWLGVLSMTAGLVAISVGLDQGTRWGWGSAATIGMLVLGAIGLAAFVLIERSVTGPLIAPELLRNRTFGVVNLAGALLFVAYFPMLMYCSLLLQDVLGFSPMAAGAGMLPLVAFTALLSRPVARLSGRVGATPVMTFGLVLTGLGSLWLGLVTTSEMDYPTVFGPLVVFGIGFGFTVALNSSSAVTAVSPGQSGTAAGINFAGRLLGGAIGLAIIGALFEGALQPGPDQAADFVAAFEPAMFVIAAVSGAGAVLNQTLGRPPSSTTGPG